MIGRMLVAIITGQMLGSTLAGLANDAYGWRSGLGDRRGRRGARRRPRVVRDPAPAARDRRRGRCASVVRGAVRPRLREPEGDLALCRGGRGGRADLRRLSVHRPAADRAHRQQHRERAEPRRIRARRVRDRRTRLRAVGAPRDRAARRAPHVHRRRDRGGRKLRRARCLCALVARRARADDRRASATTCCTTRCRPRRPRSRRRRAARPWHSSPAGSSPARASDRWCSVRSSTRPASRRRCWPRALGILLLGWLVVRRII